MEISGHQGLRSETGLPRKDIHSILGFDMAFAGFDLPIVSATGAQKWTN